jgi:alpha-tubulin suppressor-like RCC1 family protein
MFSTENKPAGIGRRRKMSSKIRSLLYVVFSVLVLLIGSVFADRAEAVTPQIAAGYFHSLALNSDGTLWAWGFNGYGQLGIGTTTNSNSMKQIGSDNNWVSIAAGYFHNLAIRSDGTLWAWGNNLSGQLGDGTTTNSNSPKQIGSDNNWVSIAAGYYHTLAIRSDGTLWAWGYNGYGQLGDGTIIDSKIPKQIGSGNNWVSITAGYLHTLAIRSDGTLWAWGYNSKGQLGDGTTTKSTSPKQIGSNNNWVSIAAGEGHTLAIRSDGTLWAWGYNLSGQLGDGTTFNSTSPKQIGSDKNWASITAGYYYTLAIRSDGTLWAWGYNGYGQLGDGTITNINTPKQIGSDKNWVSIAAGDYHSLALKSDGTLWAWGYNDNGQLGICSTNNKTSPVQIQCDLVTDLIIQSITTNPVNPGAGQNVTVTVTVKNQGTFASGQFIIDLYKALPAGVTPNPPGDNEDFWCTVTSLSADATDSSCTKSVTYSNAGSYYMWAYVDSANNVSESNELNNVYGPQVVTVCNLNAYYYDADIDGYGDPNSAIQACYQPVGYITNSLDCDDADSTINPYAVEICDNKDNDCDGQTDEGLSSIAITCGIGECTRTGNKTCTNGAWVNSCTSGAPLPETCDNKDNNCDGAIDNGLTRPTTCGAGVCLSTGTETCSAGLWGNNTCTVKLPVAETCNNIDDDCDGIIDNDLTRPTACGAGACLSAGTETCSAGLWGNNTCTVKLPVAETCNNIDDDCDGIIDNDLTRPTACGAGACLSAGTETCSAGLWGSNTCTAKLPVAETCNNIDDDCDGAIDNGLTRPTACGAGACSSAGTETCSAGLWGNNTCTVKLPVAETCNNIDDDCDGTIDNDLTRPTACGAGACSSAGTETCSAGLWGSNTCTAKLPVAETCNNIDDDCDGQVDEDLIPTPTSCGQGVCAATGLLICQNGQEVSTCINRLPLENSETTCNDNIDNDCDGFTDGNDSSCITTSDLAVTSVSKHPAIRKLGRSFNVTAKVINKGVGAADKEFTVGYYLSKNKDTLINKEVDILLTDEIIVSLLPAGAGSKGKIKVNIPMDMPKGKYYVKVCADNRNDIAETNEDNNCRASSYKIRVK